MYLWERYLWACVRRSLSVVRKISCMCSTYTICTYLHVYVHKYSSWNILCLCIYIWGITPLRQYLFHHLVLIEIFENIFRKERHSITQWRAALPMFTSPKVSCFSTYGFVINNINNACKCFKTGTLIFMGGGDRGIYSSCLCFAPTLKVFLGDEDAELYAPTALTILQDPVHAPDWWEFERCVFYLFFTMRPCLGWIWDPG